MKLSERSYPHPVVGNRDDVPNSKFESLIEMSSDKENIYLDVKVACTSETIIDFLGKQDVCYLLHVDCSNTFFRKSYQFSQGNFRQTIASENLNDLIEVNVFAVAAKDIPNYRVLESHPDYEDTFFYINEGDVLAVSDTVTFHIDNQFDSMRRISSIMHIIESSSSEPDLPLMADMSGDKIIVLMPKQEFSEYKLLKVNEHVVAPLTVAIVLPVLIEALQYLKSEYQDSDDDECPKWVVVLRRKIKLLDLEGEDVFVSAQKLLELPIKRALASARKLVESEE